MDKLIITVGLPGSGKTTWSKEQAQNDSKRVKYIDIDYHMFENYKYEYKKDLKERFSVILHEEIDCNYKINIIDGLFLNNDDILRILKNIGYLPDEMLEIHYWNENREISLWNDKYRRELDSKITIENADLEKIDIIKIREDLNLYNDEIEKQYGLREDCYDFYIALIEHTVERKPEWQRFVDKYDIDMNENDQIISQSWKVGGSWWSYTGAEGDIESEPEPKSFDELDDILRESCSNITFSQRREIMNECVKIESKTINDYYSREDVRYFVCDIENLYEVLNNMNLIDLD